MAANGQLPASSLSAIPGGRLSKEAARAWNAGPAQAGLLPAGSASSYRKKGVPSDWPAPEYGTQYYFRGFWCSQGACGNAAVPGTSNHGWGNAIDLKEPWMRVWIDNHGARYGWKKVEAFNEWWHVNYVGGFDAPVLVKPRLPAVLTKKEVELANKLRYHRHRRKLEGQTGQGPNWHKQDKWCKFWFNEIEKHIQSIPGERFKRPRRREALRNVLRHKFDWKLQ